MPDEGLKTVKFEKNTGSINVLNEWIIEYGLLCITFIAKRVVLLICGNDYESATGRYFLSTNYRIVLAC